MTLRCRHGHMTIDLKTIDKNKTTEQRKSRAYLKEEYFIICFSLGNFSKTLMRKNCKLNEDTLYIIYILLYIVKLCCI